MCVYGYCEFMATRQLYIPHIGELLWALWRTLEINDTFYREDPLDNSTKDINIQNPSKVAHIQVK